MSAPCKLTALFILTVLCTLPITYGMVVDDPLIVVNSEKVDKEYAELLMDKFYTKRTIGVNSDKEIVVNENIIYNVPAIDEFEINDGKGKLYVKFTKDGESVTYKTFEYEEELESSDEGDEVTFMGKTYRILEYESGKIVLGNTIEDFETSDEFTYDGYTIKVVASNSDSEIMVSVYKGSSRVDSLKMYPDDSCTISGSSLSLYYDEYLLSGDTPYFFFELSESLELEDGESFEDNGEFDVELDDKLITLDYNSPKSLSQNFNLLNYNVNLEDASAEDLTVFFTVTQTESYEYDMDEGTKYFGNNIFAVKIENDEDDDDDDELYLYKNNKQYSEIVDYQGSVQLVDQDDLLNASSDLILIGGPVSNKVTNTIQDKLSVEVSNDYPGEGKGVIQTITNPNNKESTILVLAGSDREGTKACVLALNQGLYSGTGTLMVELTGDNSVRVI
ncbi:S-layer protein [Methanococcus sp. CF]